MAEVTECAPSKRRTRGRPLADASVGPDVILRAARRTFAKRGYDATSVREVARELGIDAALIAHHFGTKETLWLAVVEQIAELAQPMFDALRALRTSSLPHRERMRRAIELCVDHEFDEPDIGMFFSTAATEEGARLDRLRERLVRPYHDAMFPLMAEAVDAGAIRPVDPDVLFFMIASAVGTTVSYSHLILEFTSLPTRQDAFRQAVLDVALNFLLD
ncbi:bacterial regulatory s, tetR family protein [Burkholderia ambifaria AMMD]|uniref:Transcriptional regulator, TetR family n=1 Tax=Burkholderia ambifaria (strain ATCC BAA-244 / DSM 16087 / CCUG 44356 / LMG 19182 / AMMD) TaxID=339670 RepID=Q0B837_BURCM|nr:TetR/AcrR family transcriptional regulator [Burkholderia ambifaria]ABI89686.1 transcriptional regulator, TetR family [Burkholderia ambifaria AMMD]AJY24944.1 bacterial regulatory s, tetR family protein [Burkholderia ambifaria AMMD]MBR7930226.1 helix-turn-helix transcriptional regulator [Burkholderia ambifaria]MBR8343852.1 helix-turn-helix transcriptional regulator [Burkholderia ambifaria]PEH67801.1 TetR/AcrR family transcriptional regulator [Burkholderia ambifaria]